jgi:hypothetical protein
MLTSSLHPFVHITTSTPGPITQIITPHSHICIGVHILTLASPDRSQIPQFTRNTEISDFLPILEGLQPHTCQCTATDTPDFVHDAPPHLLIVPSISTLLLTPPQPQQLHMLTKLDIPMLSGSLDASMVNGWLNLCQNSFEVHAALNTTVLKPTI